MNKIEIAEDIAKKISTMENIKDAYVDDYRVYDDYIDVQVVATLKVHKSGMRAYWPDENYESFSLRKTSNDIRKLLKTDKRLSTFGKNVECPERVYQWNGYKNEFNGYHRSYIMIDFVVL